MSEFHDQLIAKTKELFPSLSDADLTPFLLHSRASRAYEAVWLMALALDTSGGVVCRRRRLYLDLLQYSLETSIVSTVYVIYFVGTLFRQNRQS